MQLPVTTQLLHAILSLPQGLVVLLQQKLGNVGSVGMGQAMKLKWIALDKSSGQPVVKRKVQACLQRIAELHQGVQHFSSDTVCSNTPSQPAMSCRMLLG